MLFLNVWEIERLVFEAKRSDDEVLVKAVRLLSDLKDLVNESSDGWAYWGAPVRAAKRLMEEIRRCHPSGTNNFRPEKMTEAELKKAITPIKRFMTVHAKSFQGKTLNFPV